MLRESRRAWLLLLLASPAFSSTAVEDQSPASALHQLDTGDWNERIRAVHELEYMQEAGIPDLAYAAGDGDWQVRMAAVHALGPLGPKSTPILQSILKHEPCPVVRLVALHNLGSRAAEGAEEKAIGWMFSASETEVNDCRDQPEPGRAPWAARLAVRASRTRTPAAHPLSSEARAGAEEESSAQDSTEAVVTPDVPAPRAAPEATAPAPSPAPPTKSERFAELDAILAEPARPEPPLGAAAKTGRRRSAVTAAAAPFPAPSRAEERAELSRRRTGPAESLPRPVVTIAAPERPVEGEEAFEAAGGKAPHDAMPDLLLALKNGNPAARSRAADELGSRGASAAPAVPALMRALRDKSPRVRASAGLALGNIGADVADVVPLLARALKDRNPDVRYAAALALSRAGTPAAREAFKRRLSEDGRRAIEKTRP